MSNTEKTATPATDAAPAEKKTQVSTTVTPAVLQKLQNKRWEGRHEKLSDVVHAAILAYVA